MKLSIIIPIHNEEKTLEKVVFETQRAFSEIDYEIILVDDGSNPPTHPPPTVGGGERRGYWDKNILLLRHDKNYGKGRAVQSGLKRATGDYIAIQDADLEYDPKNLYELWKIIHDRALDSRTESKALSGCVIYGKRSGRKGYFLGRLGNKILSMVCNILFGSKMSDIYTCYKIIPSGLMRSLDLQSNGFEIEAEITAKILQKKINILETPIPYSPRTFSEGKHIRWKDGFKGIFTLIRVKIRN